MSFLEKVTVVIETKTDQARQGLLGIKSAVAEAEGGFGKFRAGLGATGKAVGSLIASPAGLMALGTAFLGAGIKGVQAFENTARSAITLSKATGLSVEQASRWIATADDAGVSAEQLGTSIGRLDKTLNSPSWEKYGVATHDAAGNVRDANAVFLDAMSALSAMTDSTARAQAGQELFGKGWAGLAPLIGHTRDEYEKMLGSVSEGQVITDGEAAKSEKWRLAMDNLQDSLGDVGIALGEVIADGAPVLNLVARLTEKFAHMIAVLTANDAGDMSKPLAKFLSTIKDHSNDVTTAFTKLAVAQTKARSTLGNLADGVGALGDSSAKTELNLRDMRQAFDLLLESDPAAAQRVVENLQMVLIAADAGDKEMQRYAASWGLTTDNVAAMAAELPSAAAAMNATADAATGMSDAERDAAYEAAQMRDRVSEATAKVKDFHDELSGHKSLIDLKIHLRDNAKRLAELDQQFADGKLSAEDYYYGVDQLTTDSQLSVEEYSAAIGNIPPEAITNIVTNMDPRSPDAIFAKLQAFMDGKKLFVTVEGQIADSALRNALEGRGSAGVAAGGGGGSGGGGSGGGSGGGTSGGGHNGGPRLNALDGPQRGGDVYLQIDRQTLVVFKNALDDLSRGTR